MKSIGSRIQAALVGSVSLLAVCTVIMLSINQINTVRNQQIIDTMTMEYSIISLSEELIQHYNSVVKNPGNSEVFSNYQATHAQILTALDSLQKRVSLEENKVLLIGVDHTARKVLADCDQGLKEVEENNFQFVSDHYAQAHKDQEYVRENTTSLLHKELQYLTETQQKQRQFYYISLSVTMIIFIIVFFGIIIFARSFAKQLITPLTKLSIIAKEIAGGNLQAMSQQTIQISNDETGSLTQSIRVMVDKLTGMLTQQQLANEEIKKATANLKEKNDELTRMNSLMVGRELKMAELKKQIEDLKSHLPQG